MATIQPLDLSEEIAALDDKIDKLLASASARMNGHTKEVEQIARLPKLTSTKTFTQPYISQVHGVAQADPTRLVPEEMKQAGQIRKVEDPVQIKHDKEKALKATAGSDWFNLPKTNLTPQLKKDLQLLHMRNVLDPKRHFKSQGKKFKVPEFSQVGTIIEGPTEFYSARIAKKDRSQSLAAGLLADKSSKNKFKSKYGEVQKSKTSGKKAFYKKQQAKRKRP